MGGWVLLDLYKNKSPVDKLKGIQREKRSLTEILTVVFGSAIPSPMWLVPDTFNSPMFVEKKKE